MTDAHFNRVPSMDPDLFREVPVVSVDMDTADISLEEPSQADYDLAVPAEEVSLPQVNPGSDEATAFESGQDYKHIQDIAYDMDPNGRKVPLNKPDPGKITAALSSGETVRLVARRAGPGKPLRLLVHESLETDGANAVPGTSTIGPGDEQPDIKIWARLVAQRQAPPNPETPQPQRAPLVPEEGPANEGLDIEKLAAAHTGAIEVVYNAQPVGQDVVREVTWRTADRHDSASRVHSRQREARTVKGFQEDTLGRAKESVLVQRTVLVGVESPEELARVARTVAGAGFTDNDRVTWTVETDPSGQPRSYTSREQALAAPPGDLVDAFIAPDEVAREITYPAREVAGVGQVHNEHLALNRRIPDGQASVVAGEIIDHAGRPQGPLRIERTHLRRMGKIFGGTGAGKTVLVRFLAGELAQADWEESKEIGNPNLGGPTIIIDMKKNDNYGGQISRELAGRRLPADRATVRVISPGSEGVKANINLLRLTEGVRPSANIITVARALSANIRRDPQAVRVFEKFAGLAIKRAYENLGWNVNSTGPPHNFEFGPPPTPTLKQVEVAISQVIAEEEFSQDSKGDIGSFTQTTLRQALLGIGGQLFQGGYDIDWAKVLDSKGVIVIDLGRLETMDSRRIALVAALRGLRAEMVRRCPAGDTNESRANLIMDETGGVFDGDSEIGQENAEFFAIMRGYGLSMYIAQQGNIDDLAEDVRSNTHNTWAMRITNPKDREALTRELGLSSEQTLLNADIGEGVYRGIKMQAGTRFRTPHPDTIRQDPGILKSGEDLFDMGTDPEFFDCKEAATEFLLTNPVGNLVRAVSEINVALTVTGHHQALPDGEFRAKLRAMTGKDATMRDAAIITAVTEAVNSRPQIMHSMYRSDLIEYVSQTLLADLKGLPPPTKASIMGERLKGREQFGLQLPEGYYGRIKDELRDRLIAYPLKNTAEYVKVLGPIGGRWAEAQLSSVTKKEEASLAALAAAVSRPSTNPLNDEELATAITEYHRLAGRADPSLARSIIQQRVSTHLKRELEAPELLALQRITERPSEHVGYAEMRTELLAAIKTAQESPALSGAVLEGMENLYQENFGQDAQGNRLKTAAAQLKEIERREATRRPTFDFDIEMTDLLFAQDLMKGGSTLDNVIGELVRRAQPGGRIYRQQEQAHNKGQAPSYSVVSLFARADPKAGQWGARAGALLTGTNLKMPMVSAHALSKWIGMHLENMRERAQEMREIQRQDAATQGRRS